MPNLNNLFNVAPTTASFFSGQQMANQNASEQLRNQELAQTIAKMQQEQEFAAKNNPLKLEHQRLVNQGLGIGNETSSLTNDFTRGTQASKIGATNAENHGKISKEQFDEASRVANVFTKGAYEVEGMPTLQRATRLSEIARQHGYNPQDPVISRFIQMGSDNPRGLIDMQTRMMQDAARNNPQYMGTVDAATIRANAAIQQTGMRNKAMLDMNDANIKAGKFNKRGETRDALGAILKNSDVRRVYPLLINEATRALRAGDQDAFEDWMFQADALEPAYKAALGAEPKPGQVDLQGTTQGRVTANPALNVRPTNLPPARQTPTSATQSNAPAFKGNLPPQAVQMFQQNIRAATTNNDAAEIQRQVQFFNQTFGPGAAESLLQRK